MDIKVTSGTHAGAFSFPTLSFRRDSHTSGPSVSTENSVSLVCRENRLYENLLQTVDSQLRRLGVAHQIITFPSDSSESEIEQTLKRLADAKAIQANLMVCDLTTLRANHLDPSSKDIIVIDQEFAKETEETIFREYQLRQWGTGDTSVPIQTRIDNPELLASRSEFNRSGEAITKLLTIALQREMPDRIDLCTGQLLEHLPFFGIRQWYTKFQTEHGVENSQLTEERFESYRRDSVIPTADLEALHDAFHIDLPQAHEVVTEWLTAAGVPPNRIRVIYDFEDLKPEDFPDDQNIWILGDRHLLDQARYFRRLEDRIAGTSKDPDELAELREASKRLFEKPMIRLPIDTFVRDLISNGFLSPSDVAQPTELLENVSKSIVGKITEKTAA